MDKTKPSPPGSPSGHTHHDLMAQDFESLRAFWERHGLKVTVVACIILAVVGAVRLYHGHQRRVNREAENALAEARSVQDLEAVVQDYRSASITPVALLQLAKVYYDGDRLDQAMQAYEDFQERYPKHILVPAARLGVAQVQEARGQLETAAKAFERFAADHPDSFLEPQAVLGHARCLEQLGRREEARRIYEDFIVSHTNDVWSARAHEALEDMDDRPLGEPPALLSAPPEMPALDFGEEAATAPIVIAPPQAPATQALPEAALPAPASPAP